MSNAPSRRAAEARARDAQTLPPLVSFSTPTLDQLLQGWPPFEWHGADLATWAVEVMLHPRRLPEGIQAHLTNASDKPLRAHALDLAMALDEAASSPDCHPHNRDRFAEMSERARFSAALLGDVDSCLIVARLAGEHAHTCGEDHLVRRYLVTQRTFHLAAGYLVAGTETIDNALLARIRARAVVDVQSAAFVVGLFDTGQVRDDTGWVPDDDGDDQPTFGDGVERVVVMPRLSRPGRKDAIREIAEAAKGLVGVAMPLVPVPLDWGWWTAQLDAEFPHAHAVTRIIAAAQRGRTTWGGVPFCLRGAPGGGKTRFFRRAAELGGLPFSRYACDQATDNSFAGTPSRWSTCTPNFPLAEIQRHRVANPVICLDEVEKAGGSRGSNGGKLHDCLVSVLEPESARTYRDAMFDAECDLSHVLWWMTCNDVVGIPGPILDRIRIVEFPLPGAEHLAALAPQIAREIVKAQGLDQAFGTLDDTDLRVLAEHWHGGSLRRLTRLVETALASRETLAPRH